MQTKQDITRWCRNKPMVYNCIKPGSNEDERVHESWQSHIARSENHKTQANYIF